MPVFPFVTSPSTSLPGGMPKRLMTMDGVIYHVTQDGAVDEYGTPTEVTTVSTSKCAVWQESADETTNEAVQRDAWKGAWPAGTAIDGGDRVEVDAMVFEVDGPVWPATNLRTGAVWYVQTNLKRAA